MDLGLRNRFYILLGGSKGLGFETAKLLAAEGARIALISRTGGELARVAAELAASFDIEAAGFVADSSVAGSVEEAIARSIARFGPPRGLLVTSGLTSRNGDLLAASDADWEANFQDVLMGHVRACRAVVPTMIAAGGGNIVTTAAYSARAAKPFLFPYASQKAAIINLTKNIAKTYGANGIRANCVCPGAFETERVQRMIEESMVERGIDRAAAAEELMAGRFKMPVAMRRPGRAHEAGELMAFLLSERAAYLTGAIIPIDGGTDF